MRNRAENVYQEFKNGPMLDIYYLFLIHASFFSDLLGIYGGWIIVNPLSHSRLLLQINFGQFGWWEY